MSVDPEAGLVTWSVVVPVRPWWLAPEGLGRHREHIARAMALDVIDVVAATACVDHAVVVTAEAEAAAIAKRHGMAVLEDRPLLSSSPAADAVLRGVRWIGGRHAGHPVAVVPADLPALTAGALTEALARLGAIGEACVPDLRGRGATVRATADPASFVPVAGADALRGLSRLGVRGVMGVEPALRHDVDDLESLSSLASSARLGRRTVEVVERLAARRARV